MSISTYEGYKDLKDPLGTRLTQMLKGGQQVTALAYQTIQHTLYDVLILNLWLSASVDGGLRPDSWAIRNLSPLHDYLSD